MPKAILQNQRETNEGWERDYLLTDNSIITLKLDSEFHEITFWREGEELGKLEELHFVFTQEDDNGDYYLLARMYVPIIRQGLGRAALEFFIELTGAKVFVQPLDGQNREDGSELTGDAPAFVAQMQAEGLIEPYPDENDSESN